MNLIARRLFSVVPTLLIVLLAAMLLLDLMPGDPARLLAGEGATVAQVTNVRVRLGLDRNVFARYGQYLFDALRGNLGESFTTGRSVSAMVGDSLPVTAWLSLFALTMAVVIAVPVGLLGALFKDRWIDRLLTGLTSLFVAVPAFVVCLVLVVLMAVERRWFPVIGYTNLGSDPVDWARHLFLPAAGLALPSAAELARQLRGALIDTLETDFVRSQYAKGISTFRVVGKHASKNAGVPVVTVLGLQAGRLLGGAVIVESIFVLPGFGNMAYQAILGRDFPVIQAVVLVSGVIVTLLNLLVDMAYLYFNPKLRAVHA